MARPRKEIDQKTFEKLCALQCTKEEICDFLDVTEKTLNGWCKREYGEGFSLVFSKKRNKGKVSLRRTQWKLAEKNATMAIFLGKQYLGQSDKQEVHIAEHDTDDGFIAALNGTAKEDWNDGDGE